MWSTFILFFVSKKMTFHLKSQIGIGVKFFQPYLKLFLLTLPGVTLWKVKNLGLKRSETWSSFCYIFQLAISLSVFNRRHVHKKKMENGRKKYTLKRRKNSKKEKNKRREGRKKIKEKKS